MNCNDSIFVAGHTGLVGSAIMRLLRKKGFSNIITADFKDLDLRNQQAVHNFFKQKKPVYVFLAAARVGGIKANSDFPAEFIYDNIMIQSNVIHAAYQNKVQKLLFLGSSCIYPKECEQPISESALLTGKLEPTNEPYALAKIAGIKMCQAYKKQYGANFISCMPTNLYGPRDNFNPETSHVVPGLIAKFHNAKMKNNKNVTLWGTGKPLREFLYVDDLASALLFLMNDYNGTEHINIGVGTDISIAELAQKIKSIVGFQGDVVFDISMPDGTLRKKLNVEKITALGWKAAILLEEGLARTYDWYQTNHIQSESIPNIQNNKYLCI